MSLIETAKANGHGPYKYLDHLFKALPRSKAQQAKEALLLYRLDLSSYRVTGELIDAYFVFPLRGREEVDTDAAEEANGQVQAVAKVQAYIPSWLTGTTSFPQAASLSQGGGGMRLSCGMRLSGASL